jgi:hypothetical protein
VNRTNLTAFTQRVAPSVARRGRSYRHLNDLTVFAPSFGFVMLDSLAAPDGFENAPRFVGGGGVARIAIG